MSDRQVLPAQYSIWQQTNLRSLWKSIKTGSEPSNTPLSLQQFSDAELQFACNRPWWIFLPWIFQERKVMRKTGKYTEEMR